MTKQQWLTEFNGLTEMFNNAPLGHHILDSEGTILIINDVELMWFGYETEEMVGKKIADFMHPDKTFIFKENFLILKEKGIVTDLEFEIRCKDGSYLPVSISARAVYDDDGKFILARGTIFHLLRRRELEDELKAKNLALNKALEEINIKNQALYDLNQEKNRFLGIASHDLQNPLTNLRLLTDKFQLTESNLTERQKFWVNDIRDTVENMTGRIRNLLSVNRIEQGANMPTMEVVKLNSFVMDLIGRFQNLADRKNQRIHFESETQDISLRTDPAYLVEIIENLLSNAIKFSPNFEEIFVKIKSEKHHVNISVTDHGQGIKPEEIPLLFGKFQKLSTRPTGGETSSGLGLSIVKEISQKIGGNVSCVSEYGHGATFILEFKE